MYLWRLNIESTKRRNVSGPMYTMKKGLKNKVRSSPQVALCSFAVIASFSIGNRHRKLHCNVCSYNIWNISSYCWGCNYSTCPVNIIGGELKQFQSFPHVVVPVMAIFYVIAGIIVILEIYISLVELS